MEEPIVGSTITHQPLIGSGENGPIMTSLPADLGQRQRALDVRRSYLVQAPAGSGKTELLTQRALVCLTTVNRPEEVVVITFTNKAVNEARLRILAALALGEQVEPPNEAHKRLTWELARQVLQRDSKLGWNIRFNPSRLRVMTIDKLNAVLAGQLPLLSGLGGPAHVDDQPTLLYEEAVRSLMDEYEDESLNPSVQSAITSVLEFAGNRQDTINHYLVDLLSKRDQWLGVIHHNDAFEMSHVLSGLIATRLEEASHDLPDSLRQHYLSILKTAQDARFDWIQRLTDWPNPVPDELEEWKGLLTILLTKDGGLRRKMTVKEGFPPKAPETVAIKQFLSDLHEQNDASALAERFDDIISLPTAMYPASLNQFREAVAVVLVRLVAHLRLVFEAHGVADFIEIGLRAVNALGAEESASDILLRQDYLIQHILLDEAQDTSARQYDLISRLTSGWQPDDGRTLFIVGDAQQSIYSFRQAEVGLFIHLWEMSAFGDIPLECIRLTANFRSDELVVSWFNDAFRKVFPSRPDPYASVVTFSPSAAVHSGFPGARVKFCPYAEGDDIAEAGDVVSEIREIRLRRPDATIAVLVRVRSHLKAILPALRTAGITYSCSDIDPLVVVPAISDALCLVRALWHPADRESWIGMLRAPLIGLSWDDSVRLIKGHLDDPIELRLRDPVAVSTLSQEGRERIGRFLTALDAVLKDPTLTNDLARQSESLWYSLGGLACVSEKEEMDIRTFFSLVSAQCRGGELQNIEALMNAVQSLYSSPENGDVQIMTIHKAKGLEFDAVLLPGLGRGSRRDDPPLLRYRSLPNGFLIAPHPTQDHDDNEGLVYHYLSRLHRQAAGNEARRLLYVAITRARTELILFGQAVLPVNDKPHRARSGSLLACLWPVVGSAFDGIDAHQVASRTPETPTMIPLVPRLPVAWRHPRMPACFVPRIDRADLPSETVLKEKDISGDGSSNLAERLVGTMYHAFVERIANEGVETWDTARVRAQAGSLTAGFRRMGMPEPLVQPSVETVMMLVLNTLSDERGRWILGVHDKAKSEYQLAGYLNNKWVAAVIDRCFEQDSDLWVVDYKTAGHANPVSDIDTFIEKEVALYQSQLDEYTKLLRHRHGHDKIIRRALYFPALKILKEVA